jgi:hypothetical protein
MDASRRTNSSIRKECIMRSHGVLFKRWKMMSAAMLIAVLVAFMTGCSGSILNWHATRVDAGAPGIPPPFVDPASYPGRLVVAVLFDSIAKTDTLLPKQTVVIDVETGGTVRSNIDFKLLPSPVSPVDYRPWAVFVSDSKLVDIFGPGVLNPGNTVKVTLKLKGAGGDPLVRNWLGTIIDGNNDNVEGGDYTAYPTFVI